MEDRLPCVVVTRGGAGDFWLHADLSEAGEHPVSQFGDAYLYSPESVSESFPPTELPGFVDRLGDDSLSSAVRSWGDYPKDYRGTILGRIWERVQRVAKPAPTDPKVIVALVRGARRQMIESVTAYRPDPPIFGGGKPTRSSRMSKQTTQAETTETDAAVADKASKSGGRGVRKYAGGSRIAMGQNSEGRQYGPEFNPKKVGSLSHERFARYREGMTVDEAMAQGLGSKDFDYDSKKGFISIV